MRFVTTTVGVTAVFLGGFMALVNIAFFAFSSDPAAAMLFFVGTFIASGGVWLVRR